jgi:hypothetical protein
VRLVAAAAALCLLLVPAQAAGERAGGPFLLVALNSLGTVTWRCDVHASDGFGLGFRQFVVTATTGITLRAGGRTIETVTTNPGERVRFPLLRSRRQQLTFVQGTEARSLRATVSADFLPGRDYCWSYLPPRTMVWLTD